MKVKVAIAQIRTESGNLSENTDRILRDIERAELAGADIVAFPETSISSYCCGDMFLHNGFINHQLEFLEKKIIPFTENKKICVVLGFVDKMGRDKDGFPNMRNSCAVIQNGKMETYDKILLAKRGQHEDFRYFENGKNVKVFDLETANGIVKWSPVICQDIWNDENMRDVVNECSFGRAKFVIAINQSYFYFGKQYKRKQLVMNHCIGKKIPVVYVNNFGVGDITKNVIIYSGQSFAMNENGDVICECASFAEDFRIAELNIDSPNEDIVIQKREEYCDHKLSKSEKYEEIFQSLKFCVKEFFDVSGLKKAMVYLSGGVDSSVVAGIVASAFDKKDIVFISSPTEDNGEITKNNAQKTADILDIKLHWVSMQEAYMGYVEGYKKCFNEEPSLRSRAAFQAIGRTAQSVGICHKFGSIANVGCSNHTENILGFSALNDVANTSAIGLINDLTKIEVYEMAEFINKKYGKEIIPVGLYDGSIKPSAELADNKSEDPYQYFLYAPICSSLIRHQMDIQDIIDSFKNKTLDEDEYVIWPNEKNIYENVSLEEFEKAVYNAFELSKRSVFKSSQAGPTPIISPYSRGFSSRETLLNAYKGKYDVSEPVRPINLEIRKLHLKISD
jgi:NAD+ synthase (glutamine-hydrolysing)